MTERDDLWDAVAAALDVKPETKTEKANVGRTVNELLEAGATPTDVERRTTHWKKHHGRPPLTAQILRTQWAEMGAALPPLREIVWWQGWCFYYRSPVRDMAAAMLTRSALSSTKEAATLMADLFRTYPGVEVVETDGEAVFPYEHIVAAADTDEMGACQRAGLREMNRGYERA